MRDDGVALEPAQPQSWLITRADKLVGAMLLAPLCAGQTLLALTAALVPQRFFTLVTVLFTAAAFGLGFVIMVVHLARRPLPMVSR